MNEQRLTAVKKSMAAAGIEQLAVTDPVSIFWLTGKLIDPLERFLALLLRKDGTPVFVVSELYRFPEDIGAEVLWYKDGTDAVALLAGYLKPDLVLGVDKNMAARFLLRLMALHAAGDYQEASACVDSVRARKDAEEAALMRRASALNDAAMNALCPFIKAGVTELELADQLKKIYKELDTDGFSFDPLIAFGPNAAVGHHSPDKTALKTGDCVLFDIGCIKDGYCADMTRTWFFGAVPYRMRDVYNTVKRANEAGRAAVAPGVPLRAIDAAARSVIEKAGYGQYFTHRLGHFIGLTVHEDGDVSAANAAPAAPGMIFSIEPGIYLPDVGGVRIEDLVLVTETGSETLNSVTRELTVF